MKLYLSVSASEVPQVLFAKQKYISIPWSSIRSKKDEDVVSFLEIFENEDYDVELFLEPGMSSLVGKDDCIDVDNFSDEYKRYLEFVEKFGLYFDYAVGPAVPLITDTSSEEDIVSSLSQPNQLVALYFGTLPSNYYKFFKDYKDLYLPNKIRFHGIALNDINNTVSDLPFFSVATSAYTNAARFGMTYLWDKNNPYKMGSHQNIKRDEIRGIIVKSKNFKDIGIDKDKFLADDRNETANFNTYQWKLYSDFLETRDKNPYWKEKAELVVQDKKNTVIRFQNSNIKELTGNEAIVDLGRFCDTCEIRDVCPSCKAGATCTNSLAPDIKTATDAVNTTAFVLAKMASRLNHAIAAESVSGETLNPAIRKEAKAFFDGMKVLQNFIAPKPSLATQIAAGVAAGSQVAKAEDEFSLSKMFQRMIEPPAIIVPTEKGGTINEIVRAGNYVASEEAAEDFNKEGGDTNG